MNIEESDATAAIREAGVHLGYVHVDDSHRGYLGSGSIDFTTIFRTRAATGHAGQIAFERYSSCVVGQPLEGILAIQRDLREDLDDLAAHALASMRVRLKAAREVLRQAGRSRLQ